MSLEEDPDFVIRGHFGSSVLLALMWSRDLRVWQWYLPHDGHPVEQGMLGDVSNQAYRAQWSCCCRAFPAAGEWLDNDRVAGVVGWREF